MGRNRVQDGGIRVRDRVIVYEMGIRVRDGVIVCEMVFGIKCTPETGHFINHFGYSGQHSKRLMN